MASTPPVNTENSNQQAGASDEEEFESAGMIVDTDTVPVQSNTKPAVPGENKRLIERNLMRTCSLTFQREQNAFSNAFKYHELQQL